MLAVAAGAPVPTPSRIYVLQFGTQIYLSPPLTTYIVIKVPPVH